jgi:hypothetical protein
MDVVLTGVESTGKSTLGAPAYPRPPVPTLHYEGGATTKGTSSPLLAASGPGPAGHGDRRCSTRISGPS